MVKKLEPTVPKGVPQWLSTPQSRAPSSKFLDGYTLLFTLEFLGRTWFYWKFYTRLATGESGWEK
jgi:hypothetical protein